MTPILNGKNNPERSTNGRWADLTLSLEEVLVLALKWLPVITVAAFLPYVVIWGLPGVPEWGGLKDAVVTVAWWTFVGLAVYAGSAVLHEALHVLAMFILARVPPSSLRFGFRPAEGILYVHTSEPMSAAAYRGVLVMPATIQGILPVVAATWLEIGWLAVYGYVMLVSAIGDLAVLKRIRHLDGRTKVRDHPRDIGCQALLKR